MTPTVADQLQTETVLGATIAAYGDGRAYVLTWADELVPREPAARDLARAVGVDA